MTGTTIRIRTEGDAAEAARLARELATAAGLGGADAVAIATAVSEVAMNQVRHAIGGGTIALAAGEDAVTVEAVDDGPGIADVHLALRDGWSSQGSLGLGLPGARRLVDEFSLNSRPGGGTVVRMVKRAAPAPPHAAAVLEWAVAGSDARLAAVAQEFGGGITVALACPEAAARMRQSPAAGPARVLGGDGVVAELSALDGHLTWQRAGLAHGLLLRARGGDWKVIATSPCKRAATIGVRRGDLLVLAGFSVQAPPQWQPEPAAVAGALSAAAGDGLVLAGRIERGVLERRPRSDMSPSWRA